MDDDYKKNTISEINDGLTVVGIELGSTRIKAVLIDSAHAPIASGSHGWENQLVDGVWTYSLEDVWSGIQACFADLQNNIQEEFGVVLRKPKAIGFSGMMHGYLVFDESGNQLAPFRTWRNNITEDASEKLTELFTYPIPQRWSIAHLYQAVLNQEDHIGSISQMTTLAGYVHWKLTGKKVMGIGEASGMFPIDIEQQNFNTSMAETFDGEMNAQNIGWKLLDILPDVLQAGEPAGTLTEEGARLLDPSANLETDIPLCPPEGDAGTGMVATNSVDVRTGNVSAGTSVFAMIVLENDLSKVHGEIDQITTPDGKLVGMAHSNNCTSDFNAWINLFHEASAALGHEVSMDNLYNRLMPLALSGDQDCGGLLSYGYISGEHITGFSEGRPVFARSSDSEFTLPNFIRTHLFSSLCALRTGLNVLLEEEHVQLDEIRGHGGFFKTPDVGQRIMAAATGSPVSVLETAGEGGAWGIALLAAYTTREESPQTLPEFLNDVFSGSMSTAVEPNADDVAGFNVFYERYHKGLGIEKAAVNALS